MRLLKGLFNLLASAILSVILLIALLLLVFMGTLEQTRIGLYEAQQRYFESMIVVPRLFGVVPIPLPGAYLLLFLVFINMIFGAIIRAPKRLTRPGLLIAHTGILLLVLFGVVSHHFSINGNMPLYVEESGSRIQSYYDWEVRITEAGGSGEGRQYIIPQEDFEDCGSSETGTFRHDSLPFDVMIGPYYRNSAPVAGAGPPAVDGIVLREEPPAQSAEMNVPGLFVHLNGDPGLTGLLWGMERAPWIVRIKDQTYTLSLSRREWSLPFTLTLKAFHHKKHPGTETPSEFSSDVTVQEGGTLRNAVIRMNEPLRHRGYTFYQASWGPSNAQEGDPLYSVLAVTRNPAMKWPVYASILISCGLLLHYGQVLFRYLKRATTDSPAEKTIKGGGDTC